MQNITPKRLVISRTDSIGDVILTLPMAGELKRQFPQLHIIFLGSSYTQPIVACCPYVDEFADWTEISRLSDDDKVLAFKKMQADTILHVFPRREIARLAKRADIPLRVGTSHRVYHWLTCNAKVNLSRKHSDLHESQLNLQLLSALECPTQYDLAAVRERLRLLPPATQFDALNLLSTSRYNVGWQRPRRQADSPQGMPQVRHHAVCDCGELQAVLLSRAPGLAARSSHEAHGHLPHRARRVHTRPSPVRAC